MFTTKNPSGGLTSDGSYLAALIIAVCLGLAATAKRLWVGMFLGRKTFEQYAEKLMEVMESAILVGQVASIAREIKEYEFSYRDYHVDDEVYSRVRGSVVGSDNDPGAGFVPSYTSSRSVAANLGNLPEKTRIAIEEALGAWEEPKSVAASEVSIFFSSTFDVVSHSSGMYRKL